MLGLTSSMIKPTSLAKQRSVVFDGVSNAAVTIIENGVATADNGLKPPTTGAGTDRSHSYAIWIKFNNTDADQGVFLSQANVNDGLNIALLGSKLFYEEWKDGAGLINHYGDTVLTDAMKQDWMLWVFTHSRPADNSTGVHKIYVNGTTSTYGSTDSTYNGAMVIDNGAGTISGSTLGMSMIDAYSSPDIRFLDGKIAQFGFWHRALEDTDILAMYNDPKMDWRYNSGNYRNTGIKRYYKPFSNEKDDFTGFKIRDLINYTPHSPVVCDDESNASWTPVFATKVDLGSGETKIHSSSLTVYCYSWASAAGFLDANVPAGTPLTYTFKAKIVTDSNTTGTFGINAGTDLGVTIPSNGGYQEFSGTISTATATGDLMVFTLSQVNAGDELYFKDFVITKLSGGNDKHFECNQTDQISNDAPGNNDA
tara:strand:- start:3070 stop:4341 length:1272 start_codon:yes stop_codon:yes gene_type:complete